MMRILLLTILIGVLFSSCYSYKIFPASYRNYVYTGEKKKAYILNPDLKKEALILKRGGIFEITSDSLDPSAVKIRLYPLRRGFVCSEPMLGSLITLGQIPVYLPDRYNYDFEEIRGDDSMQRRFELDIATRYWFWDMFNVKKGFDKKAGQDLLAAYYHP